ncbi:nucleoplasmin-2 [Acomys russatus]|uniref:nucleoplasmin-2 n=1 Tax=Acomys russatus TaxID=60746 RepID=UPI0021E2A280|nr:nucleoplasmin-2 [Acomys russatus]
MSRHSTSSGTETTAKTVLWGGELSQEKQICTFKPQGQGERKDNCKLLLSTICLGEKAREEMNRVEILPPANQEDRKPPVTIATLKASVLPMVTVIGMELSPPVTFRLRAGSGPVFLSGQECYETSDLSWEEEEEEEDEEDEEDEEEEEEVDISLEDIPTKQVKRVAPQKQAGTAKRKRMEKEEEEPVVRPSPQDKSPWKKGKATPKPKKPPSKK